MNQYLFLALLAQQVADILTTTIIIQKGGQELNPVERGIMSRVGVIPAMLIEKGAMMTLLWHYLAQVPVQGLVGLIVLYAIVLINNINVIRGQK